MNKEIADKWVKALRSGRFEQGSGELEAPGNKYCCLGVLCILAQEEGIPVKVGTDDRLSGGELDDQESVREWAGIKTDNGSYGEGGTMNLVYENDQFHKPFECIADIIEKHWKEL